jgi:hypothetical protein
MTLEQELQTHGYTVAEVAELVSLYPEHEVWMGLRAGALKCPERLRGNEMHRQVCPYCKRGGAS